MLELLYICNMGNKWSTLKPLNAEYIVGNYGKKTVQQIATDLNATTDRVRRVLKMQGVPMMGKSALYASIKELKFEYEDSLCSDYINGKSQTDLCKKYNIGNEKVILILDRNNVNRAVGRGSGTVLAWANGKRKPRNCNKGGTKDIHNALYGRWKANAKSRNYPFSVDIRPSTQEDWKIHPMNEYIRAYNDPPVLYSNPTHQFMIEEHKSVEKQLT